MTIYLSFFNTRDTKCTASIRISESVTTNVSLLVIFLGYSLFHNLKKIKKCFTFVNLLFSLSSVTRTKSNSVKISPVALFVCKISIFTHFRESLSEAGVMHEAGYVDSIWST